jgi:S-formylglutathione hydrolase FrmB
VTITQTHHSIVWPKEDGLVPVPARLCIHVYYIKNINDSPCPLLFIDVIITQSMSPTHTESCMTKYLFLLTCFLSSTLYAGRVDTLSYLSPALGITVSYIVVMPNSYTHDANTGKRFPVLYLLHCAGCTHLTWIDKSRADLGSIIDSVRFIAVAPFDNNRLGWWLDSPKIPNYAHSRFLVTELKQRIDSLYATLPDRQNTGVAGWSMGGFGALHTIIEHPDVFGSAFSIKGGFDQTLPLNQDWGGNNFGLYTVLGSQPSDTVNWNAVNILKNIHRLATKPVHLGHYGGIGDIWFGKENRRLDTIMTGLSIPHLFYETNEEHSSLPTTSVLRVLRFFDSVFVYTPASVQPHATGKSGIHDRATSSKAETSYDISGRKLPAFFLTNSLSSKQVLGIMITVGLHARCRVY